MHTRIKNTFFILTILSLALLTSCGSDSDEQIDPQQNQELAPNSKIADLILKTAMNDGSNDNILDGTSCFNIQLPVTVNVNGLEISIDSEQDLEIIEEVFDEFEDDLDELDLIFPITLVLNDFSEITIENESQLEEFIDNCIEDEEDEDIECLDFGYPLTVSLYNADNDLTETITFYSDRELYDFIRNLDDIDDDVYIDFPITVILADDTEIRIEDLDELEDIIEDAIDDCDENDLSEAYFTEILTSQEYEVQKYKDNESNETRNYQHYTFTFSEDSTSTVVLNRNGVDEITDGTWSVTTRADGGLDVTFDFGTEEPLSKLSKQWNVKKIKEKRIMLDDRNDGGISKDELFFMMK